MPNRDYLYFTSMSGMLTYFTQLQNNLSRFALSCRFPLSIPQDRNQSLAGKADFRQSKLCS